jgi:hypothetical protein
MQTPTPEHFRKNVAYFERHYGIVDCIYVQGIEEFTHISLSNLNDEHQDRIASTFLFDWGKMQRHLGYKGLEAVCTKIKGEAFSKKVEPLRKKSLKTFNLPKERPLIISLFSEVAGASFKNDNGKIKKLKSTTASDFASVLP